MSSEASTASTRPCGTIASSASVTRPVPQPTSSTVASAATPSSRASTSEAHTCCGWLDTSYRRASQGVATRGHGTGHGLRLASRPARKHGLGTCECRARLTADPRKAPQDSAQPVGCTGTSVGAHGPRGHRSDPCFGDQPAVLGAVVRDHRQPSGAGVPRTSSVPDRSPDPPCDVGHVQRGRLCPPRSQAQSPRAWSSARSTAHPVGVRGRGGHGVVRGARAVARSRDRLGTATANLDQWSGKGRDPRERVWEEGAVQYRAAAGARHLEQRHDRRPTRGCDSPRSRPANPARPSALP